MCAHSLDSGSGDWERSGAWERKSRTVRFKGTGMQDSNQTRLVKFSCLLGVPHGEGGVSITNLHL